MGLGIAPPEMARGRFVARLIFHTRILNSFGGHQIINIYT